MTYSEIKSNVVQIKDLPILTSINDDALFLVYQNQKTYKLSVDKLLVLFMQKMKNDIEHKQLIANNKFLELSANIAKYDKEHKDIALLQKDSFSNALKNLKAQIAENLNCINSNSLKIADIEQKLLKLEQLNLENILTASTNIANKVEQDEKNSMQQLSAIMQYKITLLESLTLINLEPLKKSNTKSLSLQAKKQKSSIDLLKETMDALSSCIVLKLDLLNDRLLNVENDTSINVIKNDIQSLSSNFKDLDINLFGKHIKQVDLFGKIEHLVILQGIIDEISSKIK